MYKSICGFKTTKDILPYINQVKEEIDAYEDGRIRVDYKKEDQYIYNRNSYKVDTPDPHIGSQYAALASAYAEGKIEDYTFFEEMGFIMRHPHIYRKEDVMELRNRLPMRILDYIEDVIANGKGTSATDNLICAWWEGRIPADFLAPALIRFRWKEETV